MSQLDVESKVPCFLLIRALLIDVYQKLCTGILVSSTHQFLPSNSKSKLALTSDAESIG